MNTLFIGQNKITLQTVDSTNNYAAKLIKMSFVPDGTVIMAQNQTEGRGQRSSEWISESGMNLLCSYILQPKSLTTEEAFYLSAAAALGAREAIESISNCQTARIKWPNDLILNDKKVGGILIENSVIKGSIKYGIIGIGVNVNQNEFNFQHATSIRNVTNRIVDTDSILNLLSEKLEKWYLLLIGKKYTEILEAYNNQLWRSDIENKIKLNGNSIIGTSLRVTPDGNLSFNSNGTRHNASFSEARISYE